MSNWIDAIKANQPTKEEKELYELFAASYVQDYDPIKACIRIGIDFVFAESYAYSFLNEQTVQLWIQDYEETIIGKIAKNNPEEIESKIVAGYLREAMSAEKASDRIKALDSLSTVLGLKGKEITEETLPEIFIGVTPNRPKRKRSDSGDSEICH